ncbi:MAG: hypothetical protein ACQXXF_05315, partial [Thermoplasmatota archaeon]
MKKIPITQYLFQCRMRRSSNPSFNARMNSSAASHYLYKRRIFSGSASTLLSSIKNPSKPLMYG